MNSVKSSEITIFEDTNCEKNEVNLIVVTGVININSNDFMLILVFICDFQTYSRSVTAKSVLKFQSMWNVLVAFT